MYFFDVYDDDTFTRDEFGVDLEDLREARDQAVAILPDLARDSLPGGETHVFMAEVRSADGHICYRAKRLFEGAWTDPWDLGPGEDASVSHEARQDADRLGSGPA